MVEQLEATIYTDLVVQMKNPTILMNEKDFELFKTELEQITNIEIGDNIAYRDIPIELHKLMECGKFIIYDKVI